ncbi:Ger(x)C family spore germination protein [Paenibacillus aquistagni]|uniref:Germination protein, Ger(X)C family n=1 Tax=Paenibacillus aquistagni TaxID=1852522 RepID=A0A1X7J1J4_9BACL|nr:Ger(x)C family spore germination protein [Paenibacillus aquistagni]SMG21451.1 germination protein, Ger(x)C family [Paenibacillus aquistagni]
MKIVKIILSICLLLLTGCWDQQMLKDDRLAYVIGYDLSSEGMIQSTTVLLKVSGLPADKSEISEVHTATGFTSRHTRDITDREVPGKLSASKLRMLLIGEDMAKQGVYPLLDVYYRDPKSALNSKVAIVKRSAHDLIATKTKSTQINGEFNKLIKSGEKRTVVPTVNLELICTHMLDPGEDFAVPYLTQHDTNPVIEGIAMFNDDKMMGVLNSEDSLMYLLMKNKLAKTASLTLEVDKNEAQKPYNYIALDFQRVKRKLNVSVDGYKQIKVLLDLKVKVTAIEYPKDHLYLNRTLEKLDQKLSQDLTHKAEAVVRQMQDCNHDGLGIGRRIIAYYPNTWKKLNWEEDYRNIEIIPKVTVEIVNHGIVN